MPKRAERRSRAAHKRYRRLGIACTLCDPELYNILTRPSQNATPVRSSAGDQCAGSAGWESRLRMHTRTGRLEMPAHARTREGAPATMRLARVAGVQVSCLSRPVTQAAAPAGTGVGDPRTPQVALELSPTRARSCSVSTARCLSVLVRLNPLPSRSVRIQQANLLCLQSHHARPP